MEGSFAKHPALLKDLDDHALELYVNELAEEHRQRQHEVETKSLLAYFKSTADAYWQARIEHRQRLLNQVGGFRILPDKPDLLSDVLLDKNGQKDDEADDDTSNNLAPFSDLVPIRLELEIPIPNSNPEAPQSLILSDTACLARSRGELEASLLARSLILDHCQQQLIQTQSITHAISAVRVCILDQLRDFDSLMTTEQRMRQAIPCPEKLYDSLRVPIRLDITIDMLKLTDKFEWTLSGNSDGTTTPIPEHFADFYVHELGLPIEFRTAVAHAIREQLLAFKRALLTSGLILEIQGKPPAEAKRLITAVDPDLASLLIIPSPTFTSVKHDLLRKDYQKPSATSEWMPIITELPPSERGRLQASKERDARRMRRDVMLDGGGGAKEERSKRRGRKGVGGKAGIKQSPRSSIDAPGTPQQSSTINRHRLVWALRSPPRTIRVNREQQSQGDNQFASPSASRSLLAVVQSKNAILEESPSTTPKKKRGRKPKNEK